MSHTLFTLNENQVIYKKFCEYKQIKKKLEIALEALLYEEEIGQEVKDAYVTYIRQHAGPAKALASELQRDELLWEESIAQEGLWQVVRWNLTRKYPYFSSAVASLKSKAIEGAEYGCDGEYLFYPKEWSETKGVQELSELCQLYLHIMLHCVFCHILLKKTKDKVLWNLAFDIYVEAVMKKEFPHVMGMNLQERIRRNVLGEREDCIQQKREEILMMLEKGIHPFQPEGIYRYIKEHPEAQEWISLFKRDSHEFWERNAQVVRDETVRGAAFSRQQSYRRLALAEKWSGIQRQTLEEKGQSQGRRGSAGGNQIVEISLEKKKKYDYRRFLERFTIPGEEMMLDLDSFDYIPYTYSRQHYDELVFMEPLEYAEVHKLKELIIAIDTSGSCRGNIVKQFLEETYEILSRKENFFRKMRVHLFQCDSFIQEYVCIESQEQWKEYVQHLKVKGFGGTDFRPVFEKVEQLREKKEIRKPGGLIYFTDGDGIYPQNPPDYETAFVFLNDSLKKGEVPPWAIELNLQIALK